MKKSSQRDANTVRAGCSKVRTPPARPSSARHRQDRLQYTAPLCLARNVIIPRAVKRGIKLGWKLSTNSKQIWISSWQFVYCYQYYRAVLTMSVFSRLSCQEISFLAIASPFLLRTEKHFSTWERADGINFWNPELFVSLGFSYGTLDIWYVGCNTKRNTFGTYSFHRYDWQ